MELKIKKVIEEGIDFVGDHWEICKEVTVVIFDNGGKTI